MKAAVTNGFGRIPRYMEFPEPIPFPGGVPVAMKATALENFDKNLASGTHYSSKKFFSRFPAIVGTDGVGMTNEGKLVLFGNLKPPHGSFAEKAIAGYTLPIPDGIDPVAAAAIPASVLTSLLPLKHKANLQKGDTVLINGATGVSGRIAIAVANMLGAGKIIGTGRNKHSLKALPQLGATTVIDLKQNDQQLLEAFRREGGENGYDVVLDFLWGRPANILIEACIPPKPGFAHKPTRYIQAGEQAGAHVSLPASALRNSGLEISGVGPISQQVLSDELNNVWSWMRENKFQMDIEQVHLSDIEKAWKRKGLAGRRLVIVP